MLRLLDQLWQVFPKMGAGRKKYGHDPNHINGLCGKFTNSGDEVRLHRFQKAHDHGPLGCIARDFFNGREGLTPFGVPGSMGQKKNACAVHDRIIRHKQAQTGTVRHSQAELWPAMLAA